MKTSTIGILGVSLLIVGVIGMLVVGGVFVASNINTSTGGTGGTGGSSGSGGSSRFTSAGERIYFTGVGSDGREISRSGGFGMMGTGGCVNCHGQDGRGGRVGGGMMESINIPDIRYSTLTSPQSETGGSEPAWTDEDIAAAVREGREPGGETMSEYMPRWDITDSDMRDLIAYMKQLG